MPDIIKSSATSCHLERENGEIHLVVEDEYWVEIEGVLHLLQLAAKSGWIGGWVGKVLSKLLL